MGNVSCNLKSDDYKTKRALTNMVKDYKSGDVESFEEIMKFSKKIDNKNEYFEAWKIGCLYYFLLKLPERQHDLGEKQSKIITKFKEVEARTFELSGDESPMVQQKGKQLANALYIATGQPKYQKLVLA